MKSKNLIDGELLSFITRRINEGAPRHTVVDEVNQMVENAVFQEECKQRTFYINVPMTVITTFRVSATSSREVVDRLLNKWNKDAQSLSPASERVLVQGLSGIGNWRILPQEPHLSGFIPETR